MVSADGWKLNLWQGDAPELFNLNTDPGELRNLARDASHREQVLRLINEIRGWQQRTRDTLRLAT